MLSDNGPSDRARPPFARRWIRSRMTMQPGSAVPATFLLRMELVDRDVIAVRIFDHRHSADGCIEWFGHKHDSPLDQAPRKTMLL